ncbi:MAG: HEAT repeat domain-containing protein [Planctomycetota bacterium]|nr:HEAT repeat domain-containing protein [Planctomycetota bacterium]
MLQSLFLVLIPLQPLSPAVDNGTATTVRAEDPAPLPDKRPEVEQLLASFKAHTEKKGSEDRDAIAVIDKLIPEFSTSGPKDRAAIVAALGKVFDLRRNEEKEGVPNNGLYVSSATALGVMGPESSKTIVAAIDNKNLKKQIAVRTTLIRSLGKTKDTKEAVEPLIGLLQDKDSPIVSAAGEALGEFSGADLAIRKKAFEALLKVVTAAKDLTESDTNNTTARERYDSINSAFVTSLGKLSKHDERNPDKWRDWWNKNKAKNWDDMK